MHLCRVIACALVVVACRAQAQPSQASTASQWRESTPAEQGLDAAVPEAAADGSDTRTKEITLRQLLTMTAGFEGPADTVASYAALDDPVRTGMSRPLFAAPGQTFSYDNGSAHMVSAVLSRVTNSSASKFAEQHLFGPLGIERYRWPADRRGNNLGHNALALTTRGMAKLGQLHLQDGAWGGKQLLPMAYVRAATSKQNAGGPPVGLDYGYFWWVAPEHAGALIHRHVLRAASP